MADPMTLGDLVDMLAPRPRDGFDGEPYDSLVHVPDNEFTRYAEEIVDHIEAKLRADNPDMPVDATLCWGCLLTLFRDIMITATLKHPQKNIKPSQLLRHIGMDILSYSHQLDDQHPTVKKQQKHIRSENARIKKEVAYRKMRKQKRGLN